MAMQKLYAFSGLGADKRAFSKIDLSGFDVVYVEWLTPRASESLESYVHRLANYYQIPKQGAYVIGVSFGGMCIAELAKYYDFGKTVLISSAKTKYELPKRYIFSKFLPLYRFIPEPQLVKPNSLLYWLFGVTDTDERQLLSEIIEDTDPTFLKWAIDRIVHWENTHTPTNCLHIHGDSDRIIPVRHVDYSIRIKRGGHFMILNKAVEISFHIRNYLL